METALASIARGNCVTRKHQTELVREVVQDDEPNHGARKHGEEEPTREVAASPAHEMPMMAPMVMVVPKPFGSLAKGWSN